MHNSFYASGFIYHAPTQQILLHPSSTPDGTPYTLFTGKSHPDEDAITAFKRVLNEILHITIDADAIHPIYDYDHTEAGNDHFIAYVYVDDKLYQKLEGIPGWLPLKQLSKLKISEQVKQDIIVGQRVINAAERTRILEETPPEETQEAA